MDEEKKPKNTITTVYLLFGFIAMAIFVVLLLSAR